MIELRSYTWNGIALVHSVFKLQACVLNMQSKVKPKIGSWTSLKLHMEIILVL